MFDILAALFVVALGLMVYYVSKYPAHALESRRFICIALAYLTASVTCWILLMVSIVKGG